MRIKSLAFTLLALLTLLAAVACSQHKAPQPDNRTPEHAVRAIAARLKKGDVDNLMRTLLPPADYRAMRKRWDTNHTVPTRVTASDRAHFAEIMYALTVPGAKARLFAQLQPKLKTYRSKYRAQMPMLTGIVQTLINTELDKRMDLSNVQRAQTKQLVATLAQWLRNAPWGDEDKARQAIGIAVDTARGLHIKKMDQIYAMDYNHGMQAYASLWKGLRQVLQLYGLSLDRALDSIKVQTVSTHGGTARLQVRYTLLGKPLQATLHMIGIDGRWYDRGLLDYWRHARPTPPTAASTHPAVAASTARPAPATSVAPATAGSAHRLQ